jgi:hypothetical protein
MPSSFTAVILPATRQNSSHSLSEIDTEVSIYVGILLDQTTYFVRMFQAGREHTI